MVETMLRCVKSDSSSENRITVRVCSVMVSMYRVRVSRNRALAKVRARVRFRVPAKPDGTLIWRVVVIIQLNIG